MFYHKTGTELRTTEIASLLDDSLCEHHTDQNSNQTLHDPACTHSTPGWIQLGLDLNRLYIHMFWLISARPLSQIQSYRFRQGDPVYSYILNLHI